MLQTFEVGKPLPFKIREGTQMEYDSSGIMFFVNAPDLRESEIQAVKGGKIEACVYIDQPAIFMLMKITGCIDWSDAPYNINLTQSPVDLSHHFEPDQGLSMMIVLHDLRKGVVKALRVIASDAEFANIFVSAVRDQIQAPFDPFEYDKKIAQVYRQHTSEEMVKRGSGYFRIARDQ